MKRIILIILFFPLICYSQNQVSDQIYGSYMSMELDKDTTYSFVLDNTKCSKSLYGVTENGFCNYRDTYPNLYFSHHVSLNCCTQHFYQIKISGDSILITHSETGELCTCGSCTYWLTFSDQNPQKTEYHILIAGKDTTVFKPMSIQEYNPLDKVEIIYNPTVDKIYVKNKMDNKTAIKFTLLDLSGRVMLNTLIHDRLYYVNTNSLHSGFYIVQTNIGLYNKSVKIIIKK